MCIIWYTELLQRTSMAMLQASYIILFIGCYSINAVSRAWVCYTCAIFRISNWVVLKWKTWNYDDYMDSSKLNTQAHQSTSSSHTKISTYTNQYSAWRILVGFSPTIHWTGLTIIILGWDSELVSHDDEQCGPGGQWSRLCQAKHDMMMQDI